jgi:hypothetical protein
VFVNNASIMYDNEIQVRQLDEDRVELRQRWLDGDEFGPPFVLSADELRELVELAKFLGWEV